MRDIIVDTSIIINFTRGKDKLFQEILDYALLEHVKVYIPSVVLIEVFVGKEMLNKKREKEIRKLLARLERIGLSEEIALLAAKLVRESNLPFDVADFIIAATALHLNACLATKNVKHFQQIPKLKIFDFTVINRDLLAVKPVKKSFLDFGGSVEPKEKPEDFGKIRSKVMRKIAESVVKRGK